ncbi:MAG: hypothetical protein O3C70_00820, partial [Actinomycetota bacterium]|nr:hypothetical protein [Actinomycetota bacterium]
MSMGTDEVVAADEVVDEFLTDGPSLPVWSPTEFLEVAKQRLAAAFTAPVSIVGVVIETRDSKGFVTVTLGDLEPQPRFPTRLAVSLDPRTAKRVLPEAL